MVSEDIIVKNVVVMVFVNMGEISINVKNVVVLRFVKMVRQNIIVKNVGEKEDVNMNMLLIFLCITLSGFGTIHTI